MENKEKAMVVRQNPGISRDAIKYIAMLTMFINHAANALVPAESPWFEVLTDIGRCAFFWWKDISTPIPERTMPSGFSSLP